MSMFDKLVADEEIDESIFEKKDEWKDNNYDPKKPEDPSNFIKASATITALIEKSVVGTEIKKIVREMKAKTYDWKKGFISGALAATLFCSSAYLATSAIRSKHQSDLINQTVITTGIGNNTFDVKNKYGTISNTYVNDENHVIEIVNGKEKEINKVNPKNVVIDINNSNPYNGFLPDGNSPTSTVTNAYANMVINAAINSGLNEKEELRKFYQASFPEASQDEINYYMATFYGNDEPTIFQTITEQENIKENGIESVYGGVKSEHSSPRR